jgi:bisphosphoglycerate-dependent phosphoglycerate mutase
VSAVRSTRRLSSPIQNGRVAGAAHNFSTRSNKIQTNPPQTKLPHQHLRRHCYHTLNETSPFNLCFLRHGQSTWNRDNRFIGWCDTPLTDTGVMEARVAGQMLRQSRVLFDEVHTSLLRRSIRTTNVVLMELGQEYIPVYKHWRLNERNYGDLVGMNKKQVVQQFGKEQVLQWRRSYDQPPPVMSDDHPFHPSKDPRYRQVGFDMDEGDVVAIYVELCAVLTAFIIVFHCSIPYNNLDHE